MNNITLVPLFDAFQLGIRKYRTLATRLAIILCVLFISAQILPRRSESDLIFLLVFIVGASIALLFFRWPVLGLAVFVFGSILLPISIGTGTNTELNIAIVMILVLTGFWVLDLITKKVGIHYSRTLIPLGGFIVVSLLAFGYGQLPWFVYADKAPVATQVGALAIFLLTAAAFLIGAYQVKDIRWLQWLVWIYLAAGTYRLLARHVPDLGPILTSFLPRGSAGGVLAAWVIPLTAAQVLFNKRLKPFWRGALGLLTIIGLYFNIAKTEYSSGWLPMVAAMAIILFLRFPRLGVMGMILGGIFILINFQRLYNLVITGNEYSLITRTEAWRILYEIILINPVLGLGPANYRNVTAFYPILGFYVPFNSHNNYIDIIAQIGILGLLFFLWLELEIGLLGLRLRNRVPEGFPKAFVYGALGGLGGILVAAMLGDWVIPYVYNVGYNGLRSSALAWFFLGALVFLEHKYPDPNPPE